MSIDKTALAVARKTVAAAIFDPGATEGFKGARTLTEWQTDAVMRALAALPPVGGEEVDRYDQGRRDMLNALLALNPAVAAKLAEMHKREPDPYGRLPFDVVFWVSEVAAQLGIEPLDDALHAEAG
ncbi:MAG: hypothetical protein LCH86_07615 [Proteobacteria bacterium]|nr:hypothetical protein [Pseudomonadota bacterium]